MKLKDEDGLYRPIVPMALLVGGILYALFLIFIAFPWIDKVTK